MQGSKLAHEVLRKRTTLLCVRKLTKAVITRHKATNQCPLFGHGCEIGCHSDTRRSQRSRQSTQYRRFSQKSGVVASSSLVHIIIHIGACCVLIRPDKIELCSVSRCSSTSTWSDR